MAFPFTQELEPFQRAEDAWGEELRRIFGDDAGQARYEPRGKGNSGSRLRELHDQREAARMAWEASKNTV